MAKRDAGTGESTEHSIDDDDDDIVNELELELYNQRKALIKRSQMAKKAKDEDTTEHPLTGPYNETKLKEKVKELEEQLSQAQQPPTSPFKSLGRTDNTYHGLDTFDKPKNCDSVRMTSDEVTAVCPITGQPDYYTVDITYIPEKLCVESKALKLFFHTLRNIGMFCEVLADRVLEEIVNAINPVSCTVRVIQKPRGGISIEAVSYSCCKEK